MKTLVLAAVVASALFAAANANATTSGPFRPSAPGDVTGGQIACPAPSDSSHLGGGLAHFVSEKPAPGAAQFGGKCNYL